MDLEINVFGIRILSRDISALRYFLDKAPLRSAEVNTLQVGGRVDTQDELRKAELADKRDNNIDVVEKMARRSVPDCKQS